MWKVINVKIEKLFLSKMYDLLECLKIVAAVVLPNIGGIFGGQIVKNNIMPWYAELNKPNWNPPDFVFAVVWTSIYCSIGYSSYLVYRRVMKSAAGFNDTNAQLALALYGIQLALNWAWAPIFFHYQSLKWVRTTYIIISATY